MAFGGAGPLHACALASSLGMPVVVVPPRAGVFSAVGLLIQPLAAAVLAWMLLTERFGVQQALAGAVILGGILLCRLASRPASAHNAST